MKSLNNYILEKLIINKNLKCDFCDPDDEGTCLMVAYPFGLSVQRIDLVVQQYKRNANNIQLYPRFPDAFTDKSKENIYYHFLKYDGHNIHTYEGWLQLLFFKNDAIGILNSAIKNPDMNFDFNEYVPSLNNKIINFDKVYKIGAYSTQYGFRRKYTTDELQKMLNEIK